MKENLVKLVKLYGRGQKKWAFGHLLGIKVATKNGKILPFLTVFTTFNCILGCF